MVNSVRTCRRNRFDKYRSLGNPETNSRQEKIQYIHLPWMCMSPFLFFVGNLFGSIRIPLEPAETI